MQKSPVNKTFILLVFCFFSQISNARNELNVAVLQATEREAKAYNLLFSQFENTYPNSWVKLYAYDDAAFKERLSGFLTDGSMDIVYGQAGQKLISQATYLEPLNDIWNNQNLDSVYSIETKRIVSKNDTILAIPYTYYNWGFYYNRKMYQSLGLTPPDTLQDFLKQCAIFVEHGHKPLAYAYQQTWPVLAWLDYLSIRHFGATFHRDLAQGRISYFDEKVEQIFTTWLHIIKSCHANKDYASSDWNRAVSYVSEGHSAAILVGSFVQQFISDDNIQQFGFFPFPTILSKIDDAELAPTDVWTMPKTAKNKELAIKFIEFVATPKIQQSFNQALGYFPPNKESYIFGNHLTVLGGKSLRNAQNYEQYFDRLASQSMTRKTEAALIKFMQHNNIKTVTSELEAARLSLTKQDQIN